MNCHGCSRSCILYRQKCTQQLIVASVSAQDLKSSSAPLAYLLENFQVETVVTVSPRFWGILLSLVAYWSELRLNQIVSNRSGFESHEWSVFFFSLLFPFFSPFFCLFARVPCRVLMTLLC